MAVESNADRQGKLSVGRLSVAGATTAVVVFVLCWLGMAIPLSGPTHAYVTLFTAAEPRSVAALAEGSLWSLLFGGLVSALFALVYNRVPIRRA